MNGAKDMHNKNMMTKEEKATQQDTKKAIQFLGRGSHDNISPASRIIPDGMRPAIAHRQHGRRMPSHKIHRMPHHWLHDSFSKKIGKRDITNQHKSQTFSLFMSELPKINKLQRCTLEGVQKI